MPCRTCPYCDIRYPEGMLHLKCAGCGQPTAFIGNKVHHRDWAKRSDEKQKEIMAKKDKGDKQLKYAQIAAAEAEAEGIAALDRRDPRAWRFSELVDAGYDPKNARKIANRYTGPDRIDLQEARDLVKSGCPVDTAVKILL